MVDRRRYCFNGVRFRGPLALALDYLRAIQNYFRKEGRNPTDIELETIAQTWSEHCKHKTLTALISYFSSFIKCLRLKYIDIAPPRIDSMIDTEPTIRKKCHVTAIAS